MILSLEPDRFNLKAAKLAGSAGQQRGDLHVRRPVRGIVLKDDTFATLRLVSINNNSSRKLIDGGTNRKIANNGTDYLDINGQRFTDVYSNFLIQGISEQRMEKQQILETFGEPFIFLFGERARVINISGVLLNSFDFNWKAEWLENYDRFLRGTKCVENDARVFLSFDETLVGGYILSTTMQESAQDRNFVQFNFQLFVTNYSSYSKVGSPSAGPGNTSLGATISAAEAQLGRPKTVLPNDVTAWQFSQSNGKLEEPGFFDGLQTMISKASEAIGSVQKMVNGVVKTVSGLINGDIIRVPIGFEGSLVYDDPSAGQIRSQEFNEQLALDGGVIRYTTFADNLDEFVGSSDHYGSSVTSSGVAVRRDFDAGNTIEGELALVNKAREQWIAAGLNPDPPSQSEKVGRFLAKKGVGMATAGITKGWMTGSASAGLGAAATTGAFGALNLAGRVVSGS